MCYSVNTVTTFLVIIVVALTTTTTSTHSAQDEWHWGYEPKKNGPSIWAQHYPNCKGTKQSPINIDTHSVETDNSLNNLQIGNYNSPHQLTLVNTGHSIQVNVEGDIYIEGGGLGQRYNLAQFHFHWGQDSQRGSEHTVNSRQYPMEIHLVHYASKYTNLSNAQTKPDGLAVLGLLVEVSDLDNPAISTIMAILPQVQYKDEKRDIEVFNLLSILSNGGDLFFRYTGSLTTPPCHESVTWSIFTAPIRISKRQIDVFRSMRASTIVQHDDLTSLSNNYRPTQPINGRKVTTNLKYLANNNDATATISQFTSLLLLYIATLVLRNI